MADAYIGLTGLRAMETILPLNIADNGFRGAVFNRPADRTSDFISNPGPLADGLAGALAGPRSIILIVSAGQPVDDEIATLHPLLDDDDMIIDAGNANCHDTQHRARLRARALARQSWAVAPAMPGIASRIS